MRKLFKPGWVLLSAALAASVPALVPGAAAAAEPVVAVAEEDPAARVLVFSKTAAFRHSSIPAGIATIQNLAPDLGIAVDTTEDSAQFTAENLADYDAVIWLSTTGDVLNDEQQAAFEDYIEGGGGYAGIHAASDTEYTWPWYGELVGSYFANHPAVQQASVHVADKGHPSTEHLPTEWVRTDEWYNYRTNPRGKVHVLATLDESTYTGGNMGQDHPIAWCQYYNGGRSWYTGGGHDNAAFADPDFVQHLAGGISWAAGLTKDDCGGTDDSNFQKIVLDDDVSSPMGLQVAPDGRVFYIERNGTIRSIDPDTSVTSTMGRLQVHTGQENGLLGIELDPDFETNGWIYLFYSPANEIIAEPHQRLSRFTVVDNTVDLASESILLQIPHQRTTCCHSGGYLDFDGVGDLWISVGDDTSAGGAPGGYTPIDEREGKETEDAQRSSANTNDLRGKLLRITPTDEGGYTVPDGNLIDTEWGAAQDSSLLRPEIYGMGLRNPFRFSVDDRTGAVYLADYGPDAAVVDPVKGIDGRVEWNNITQPGNYGWPYCHGGGAYKDFDYTTNTGGAEFDCANPVNDSPNNTGLRNLPPVIEPDVAYGRLLSHPVIGRGGAPMGGPAYVFDPTIESDRQWPDYFDGTPLFYEWGQNKIYEMHLDDDGQLIDITQLLSSMQFTRPHDMVFGGYDGALYVIEWGAGFSGNNPDSQIVRIDYTGGNENPVAKAAATPRSGGIPLEVSFSSEGTYHPQGGELSYQWTFGDGGTSTEPNPTHTYTAEGNYTAILVVTDAQGRTGTANVTVSAGNTEPEVEILWPAHGTVFTFGDTVDWKVRVVDVEDGSTDGGELSCDDITVDLILGHDDHGHGMQDATGCEGSFVLEPDSGHTDLDRITYALEARYTDAGSPNGTVAPLTGRTEVAMQPSRKQIEHYSAISAGLRIENSNDPQGGGSQIGFVTDNTWMRFDDFNLANIEAINFRTAAPTGNGRIEVRKDTVDGELLGSALATSTGGFGSWNYTEVEVGDPGGTFDLVLVFRGPSGYLFNLNWMDFVGDGAAGGQPEQIDSPTAVLDPPAPNGADGWYTGAVTVTLAATEGDSIEYRIGTAEWVEYTGPVTLSADGVQDLQYRAVRGEAVSPRGSVEVKIDGVSPITTANLTPVVANGTFTGAVTVQLAGADATSGIATTEYRVDGGAATAYTAPFQVTGAGGHTVLFRSTDRAGRAEEWKTVRFNAPVGAEPKVTIQSPATGGVVPVGSLVPYTATVAGGEIDCDDVRARIVVTDGTHRHEGEPVLGCTGAVELEIPTGHTDVDRLRYALEVTYAQGGFDTELVNLVRATSEVRLQPHRLQAENFDTQNGTRNENTSDAIGGGQNVGYIRTGAWLAYNDVNFQGVSAVRLRVASNSVGGTVEIRQGSATGTVLGTGTITRTGGNQSYVWLDVPVTDPGVPFTMVLLFTATGSHYIANINLFEFVGSGVSAAAPTAPRNVTAAAAGGNVTVSWTAPESTGGSPVTGYVVHREGSEEPVGTVGADATSFEVTGLAAGQHRFAVSAVNAIGEGARSDWTEPVTVSRGEVQATVTPRCLGGKVYLYTSVKNVGATAVDITVSTPFGSKATNALQPGKSASAAFTTRLTSVPAGSMLVSVGATGEQQSPTAPTGYPALTC